MFFPLSDDDRKLIKPAYVTWTLLALNVALFVYQVRDPGFTYGYAAIPVEIAENVDLVEPVVVDAGGGQTVEIPQRPGPSPLRLTLLWSMFMHGGLMHLAGNMLFLWIFGDNVEHRFGHLAFLSFYLASGLAGSIAQIALDPASVIPMVGASGAISGILGAYLVLFPRNRVYAVFFFQIIAVPAAVVLVMWAVMQVINGYGAMFIAEQTAGVAYAAHIGGFAMGLAVGGLYRCCLPAEPENVFRRNYGADPRTRQWW